MKIKLTISDIAEAAGVSKTAVSFVLNNKEGVSAKTRQKVLDVIQQTNYRPTMNSKRLFFQKSFTIAVVFEETSYRFDNLFYLDIMSALLKRCTAFNYSLVYSEYSCVDGVVTLPENVLNKDVDGLVFLKDIPAPLVSTLQNPDIPFVVADHHHYNHRRIFFLGIAKAFWSHRQCRWYSYTIKKGLLQQALFLIG